MRWISGPLFVCRHRRPFHFSRRSQCLPLDGPLASRGEIAGWGTSETRLVPAELQLAARTAGLSQLVCCLLTRCRYSSRRRALSASWMLLSQTCHSIQSAPDAASLPVLCRAPLPPPPLRVPQSRAICP
ncbi:hypothetical protein K505DRAFT_36775 [Melanomma pulvis-pyrius CBS 109.77]|uniref:Uncharacterized protein n=1 Tax=Melanomma pulvis-pyrius CBS 109.77 TaxID=1314802 RepID=A0A6A6XTU9_9PLEO|nr:hypothetical protein K505DRAFT_36775 [Melanomma pulvis-pyrius CBS 109.77]